MEKQELTCNSTVIARTLLAHVLLSDFFPLLTENNSNKILINKRKKKGNLLTKIETKINKFVKIKLKKAFYIYISSSLIWHIQTQLSSGHKQERLLSNKALLKKYQKPKTQYSIFSVFFFLFWGGVCYVLIFILLLF